MKRLLYVLLFAPVFLHAQGISITTPKDTVCSGSFVHFNAAATGIATPHFRWQINSGGTGTDSSGFTTHTLDNGDTVSCLLTNAAGDTVLAVSDSIVMTVQTMPVVSPIIGSDSIVCVGATITLSDMTAGGAWQTSNSNATIAGGIVTGVAGSSGGQWGPQTLDTIIYIVANVCGADTAEKIITVEKPPFAGFGVFVNTLCVGETALADDFEEDLYSRYGYVSQVFSSDDFSYIAGVRAGRDYVYTVTENACGVDSSGSWVTVLDKPVVTLTSPTELCLGNTAQITDSTDGQFPKWSSNGIMVDKFGVVTAVAPGLATVTVTVANSCGSTARSANIIVPSPGHMDGVDSIYAGKSAIFSDAVAGGTWTSGNTDIAIVDQSGTVTGLHSGTAYVTYTHHSGCFDTRIITVTPYMNTIVIAPNPAKYEIKMEANTDLFFAYALMTNTGQIILRGNIDSYITKLDVRSLPKGIYMLTFFGFYDVHNVKFLKE